MLHVLLVLAMVYAISWIVSTPEGRAEAKPWADRLGKRLLAIQAVFIAGIWIWTQFR